MIDILSFRFRARMHDSQSEDGNCEISMGTSVLLP